jgi:type III pantothenate kinase
MGPHSIILALDAGNTRVKWGVRDAERWSALGAVEIAQAAGIAQGWPNLPPQARAIASNVAGPEVAARLTAACRERNLELEFIAALASELGVTNGYRHPGQLGPDRWAALIAAHHGTLGHKLVVNAGTALTIDALGADGRFRGGMIVPGPALMRRSLDRGTAALREIPGSIEAFPASTPDAITTGAIQACIGAVERMRSTMAAHGLAPATIVVSGGAAPELAPHLPPPVAIDESLVLAGLVRIARNR